MKSPRSLSFSFVYGRTHSQEKRAGVGTSKGLLEASNDPGVRRKVRIAKGLGAGYFGALTIAIGAVVAQDLSLGWNAYVSGNWRIIISDLATLVVPLAITITLAHSVIFNSALTGKLLVWKQNLYTLRGRLFAFSSWLTFVVLFVYLIPGLELGKGNQLLFAIPERVYHPMTEIIHNPSFYILSIIGASFMVLMIGAETALMEDQKLVVRFGMMSAADRALAFVAAMGVILFGYLTISAQFLFEGEWKYLMALSSIAYTTFFAVYLIRVKSGRT